MLIIEYSAMQKFCSKSTRRMASEDRWNCYRQRTKHERNASEDGGTVSRFGCNRLLCTSGKLDRQRRFWEPTFKSLGMSSACLSGWKTRIRGLQNSKRVGITRQLLLDYSMEFIKEFITVLHRKLGSPRPDHLKESAMYWQTLSSHGKYTVAKSCGWSPGPPWSYLCCYQPISERWVRFEWGCRTLDGPGREESSRA